MKAPAIMIALMFLAPLAQADTTLRIVHSEIAPLEAPWNDSTNGQANCQETKYVGTDDQRIFRVLVTEVTCSAPFDANDIFGDKTMTKTYQVALIGQGRRGYIQRTDGRVFLKKLQQASRACPLLITVSDQNEMLDSRFNCGF